MKPSRTPRPQLTAFQRYVLHLDCPRCSGTRDGCTFYGNGGKPFIEPERVQEPVGMVSTHKSLSTSPKAVWQREHGKRKG